MIRAEAHTDDFAATAKFDATPFFREAALESIVALSDCGWGGDYPADEVARHCQSLDGYEDVAEVFEATGNGVGFECHVHEPDALGWLKEHRNDVFLAVCEAEDISTEAPYGDERAPAWDSDRSWSGDYAQSPEGPTP